MQEFLNERLSVVLSTRTIIPKGWERTPGLPPSYLSVYGLSSWSYGILGAWMLFRLAAKLWKIKAVYCLVETANPCCFDSQIQWSTGSFSRHDDRSYLTLAAICVQLWM